MFTAKKLKKLALHGLTFGEHCVVPRNHLQFVNLTVLK